MSLNAQLSRVHRFRQFYRWWCARAQMSDEDGERLLLKHHSATMPAAGELTFLQRADEQLVFPPDLFTCGAINARWLIGKHGIVVKVDHFRIQASFVHVQFDGNSESTGLLNLTIR